MPTLNAMFKLQDGYTKSITNVITGTDRAASKILKASGVTDAFNTKLNKTGSSASLAASGIGKLAGALISMAAAKKGMDITDTYTNTSARLALINDGLQTQAELQDKIFASAQRARGSYTDMAAVIAKMGILASESFSSNNELVAFTELVQKSFKVGGASNVEQQSALLQLSQAMAAGRLQGDEFRSIMENAPMIALAIAKYTGKAKGELKEMSADGVITADIIKNSMFLMADDINDKFKKMPRTFGDIWKDISNKTLKAFEPTMGKVNELINSPKFETLTNSLTNGLASAANGVLWLIDSFSDLSVIIDENKEALEPFIFMLGGIALTQGAQKIWAIAQGMTIAGVAATTAGAAVGLTVYTFTQFGSAVEVIVGTVYGGFAILVGGVANIFILVANSVIAVAKTVDLIIAGCVNTIIAGINATISALNKLPGMNISESDYFSGLMPDNPYMDYFDIMEGFDSAYKEGALWSSWVTNGWNDGLDSLGNIFSSSNNSNEVKIPELDFSQFGSGGKPLEVIGKGGKNVKVDISKQDLKYLKDVAEREYINKFSTATLAPNVTVQFTGPISKDVDTDKMYSRIGRILKEQIAIVREG